tara:strand:+ start:1248 stop:1901 length:654 start_codon:yes stop_codon:yes gene_type:complete
MKTYKQFNEAAALALPALKAAPYVIPALGAGANILKGMMQSDASDKFKARQRGGRLSPGEVQRRQAREDRRAEAQLRARENTPKDKPVENVPTSKKPDREKVDPRLERAANQVIDSLRRGNTLSITNRETGLSDSEKKRLKDLMDRVKADKERRKVQQPEKEILNYGREKEGIAARPKVTEGYKDPMKRELKLKGQQIINDREKYYKGTTPVRVKKA